MRESAKRLLAVTLSLAHCVEDLDSQSIAQAGCDRFCVFESGADGLDAV